ncbi:holo-ACP synthase [Candidatus Roizmanbacteria bacterium]|nr:holo-ACP synthase [Candidatus Roizmanbacteria bacterium]
MYGIGIDIIETKKIKKMFSRNGFLSKIFTDHEIEYCTRYKLKELHFAGRFAAKEAAFKALGTGFGNGIEFRNVEVKNDRLGKPSLVFYGKAKRMVKLLKITNILVTISHCDGYAITQVLLERKLSER